MAPGEFWRTFEQRESVRFSEPCLRRACSSEKAGLVDRMKLERVLSGHDGCVNAATFTPEGNQLLTGSDDMHIIMWDWQTGRQLFKLPSGHSNNVFQCRPMPHTNNQTIITCAADGQVRMMRLGEAGNMVSSQRLARHRGWAHKLSIVPDMPQCFLSSGADGYVYLFDTRALGGRGGSEDGTASTRTQTGPGAHTAQMRVPQWHMAHRWLDISGVHHNPARPWLFAVSGDDVVARVYDCRAWRSDPLTSSSTRPLVVSGLYPSHMERNVMSQRDPHSPHITSLAFSRTGALLATYGNESIYLFSAAGASGQGNAAAIRERDPGGADSGSCEARGDRKRKAEPRDMEPCGPGTSDTLMYDTQPGSSRGSPEATGPGSSGMQADSQAGVGPCSAPREDHVVQKYTGHRNARTVKGVSFMGEDDQYIVSGSDCGNVFIWQRQDGRLRRVMHGDYEVVNCLEPHPWQPMVLATSGIEDTVKVWSPNAPPGGDEHVESADEVSRLLARNEREGRQRSTLRATQLEVLREEQLLRLIRNAVGQAAQRNRQRRTGGEEQQEEEARDMTHVVESQVLRAADADPSGPGSVLLRILFGAQASEGSEEDEEDQEGEEEEEEEEGDDDDDSEGGAGWGEGLIASDEYAEAQGGSGEEEH